MKSNHAHVSRILAVAPVIAAVYFHATALQRWPIALVATCILFWGAWTKRTIAFSLLGAVGVAAIGALAGLASMITSVPPGGILPPSLTSLASGTTVALVCLFVLGGKDRWAWIGSWGLIALSANSESTLVTEITLIVFLGLSLLVAAIQAGGFRTGRGVAAALMLFVVCVGAATYGFSRMATRLEGVIQAAIGGLYDSSRLPMATGIGDEILMGSRSSIAISQRVLFELSSPTGYLRVNVMDRFDGHRWFTSRDMQAVEYVVTDSQIRPDVARELQVVLFDDPAEKLPSPAGTWRVRSAEARFQGGWVLRGKANQTTLELIGDSGERLPSEPASDPHLLDVPESLHPDFDEFAEAVMQQQGVQPSDTNRAKAEAFEKFFQEQFEYSLHTDLMGPEHPLIQLIRERRPAYCAYFASAMAVSLRTQGVPARVVSGYLPIERNPITGRVTVRRRDSHAWVEAWSPEEDRFVALDPTPPRSRQQTLGVGGTPGPVSALLGAVASFSRRYWLNYQSDPTGFLIALGSSPAFWMVLMILVCVVFAKRWKVGGGGKPKPGVRTAITPELQRVYQQYLRSLRRLGVTPQPSETDDELIQRLSQLGSGEHAAKASAFMDRYRRVRFRGDPFDDRLIEMSQLQSEAKSFESV